MRFRDFPRYQFDFGRDIWLFFAYILLANIGYGVFILIFNLYVYSLGFRENVIGVFNSVQTFSVAATALMLGTAIDRLGLWRTMVIGLTIFGLSDVSLAVSTWAPALIVFSATEGVGLAVVITATMPFIIQNGRSAQRTTTATIAFAMASFSLTLGSLLGGYAPAMVAELFPAIERGSPAAFRSALLAGALLGLAGLIPLLSMREARSLDRPSRAASGAAAKTPDQTPRQARLDVRVFIVAGLVTALGTGLVSRFYNVFLQTLGASSEEIGLVYAVAGIAAAGIGLAAPLMLRRYGALRAVLMVRSLALPVFLLLIVAPWYGVAVLAHVVRMVSVNMAWPIDSTFISELLPGRLRLSVFGWRSSMWSLGIGVSSIAGGWLIVKYGYSATFAGYVALTTVGIIVSYLYFARHPRVVAGDIPSAFSTRERARRAVSRTQQEMGTVDGGLTGSASASEVSTSHPESPSGAS